MLIVNHSQLDGLHMLPKFGFHVQFGHWVWSVQLTKSVVVQVPVGRKVLDQKTLNPMLATKVFGINISSQALFLKDCQ